MGHRATCIRFARPWAVQRTTSLRLSCRAYETVCCEGMTAGTHALTVATGSMPQSARGQQAATELAGHQAAQQALHRPTQWARGDGTLGDVIARPVQGRSHVPAGTTVAVSLQRLTIPLPYLRNHLVGDHRGRRQSWPSPRHGCPSTCDMARCRCLAGRPTALHHQPQGGGGDGPPGDMIAARPATETFGGRPPWR